MEGFGFNLREKVAPGETKKFRYKVPSFYGLDNLYMPVYIQRAKKKGPCVLVTACIHGDEINSLRICHRLIKSKKLKLLKGTLIVLPTVNVYGIIQRSRYLPDRRDLNRCFPGSETGSLGSRLAYHLMNDFVINADVVIDLHTGAINRSNVPQIRCDFNQKRVKSFASKLNIPVIVDSSTRDGSLRAAAAEEGKLCMVYEAGQALRFEESYIKFGVKCVHSALRNLKMLPTRLEREEKKVYVKKSRWKRTEKSGVTILKVKVGQIVSESQVIAEIRSSEGALIEKIRADDDSIILGVNLNPLGLSGEAIINLGYFGDKQSNMEEVIDLYELL